MDVQRPQTLVVQVSTAWEPMQIPLCRRKCGKSAGCLALLHAHFPKSLRFIHSKLILKLLAIHWELSFTLLWSEGARYLSPASYSTFWGASASVAFPILHYPFRLQQWPLATHRRKCQWVAPTRREEWRPMIYRHRKWSESHRVFPNQCLVWWPCLLAVGRRRSAPWLRPQGQPQVAPARWIEWPPWMIPDANLTWHAFLFQRTRHQPGNQQHSLPQNTGHTGNDYHTSELVVRWVLRPSFLDQPQKSRDPQQSITKATWLSFECRLTLKGF